MTMLTLLLLTAAAASDGFAPKAGDRVDALPFGSKWESCVVVRAGLANGAYSVRCEGRDYDFVVSKDSVRAPRLPVPQSAPPKAATAKPAAVATPPAQPKPPASGGALKPGKYQCYYLAGTTLNYSFVDVIITGAGSYQDRTGKAGSFTRTGNDIRFTSGPLAKHRATVGGGGIELFAPGASYGMSCDL
jgi:hypothetical protein